MKRPITRRDHEVQESAEQQLAEAEPHVASVVSQHWDTSAENVHRSLTNEQAMNGQLRRELAEARLSESVMRSEFRIALALLDRFREDLDVALRTVRPNRDGPPWVGVTAVMRSDVAKTITDFLDEHADICP